MYYSNFWGPENCILLNTRNVTWINFALFFRLQMALLRLIYDSVVFLTFYVSGVCMYYHHKSYEYTAHPLTVITCKIGGIMQIILSMNLFFSSYTNNFIYIVDMIDVVRPFQFLIMLSNTLHWNVLSFYNFAYISWI